MEIIGLSGYARSGKDEAAKVLVEEFGFKRVAFADKLREVLYALNPIIEVDAHSDGEGGIRKVRSYLQDLINEYGWHGYKETRFGPEIRRLLQRLGTEAGRQTLWDSIWIDAALTGHPEDARLVVSDMRFPNEKSAIESRGGKTLRISRAGVGPANQHASEVSLDGDKFDCTINNDGTLEEYRAKIREFANNLGL